MTLVVEHEERDLGGARPRAVPLVPDPRRRLRGPLRHGHRLPPRRHADGTGSTTSACTTWPTCPPPPRAGARPAASGRGGGLAGPHRRLLLSAAGNATHAGRGPDGSGSYPPVIDLLGFGRYLLLYVALVALIRARVPRFHPSMWLDGVIGAFGTTALGVAFLIGPYLHPAPGRPAIAVVNLALPAMDVLLLALLVAVGSILGPRMDRSLVQLVGAMLLVLMGDVPLFATPSTAATSTEDRSTSCGCSASRWSRSPRAAPARDRRARSPTATGVPAWGSASWRCP